MKVKIGPFLIVTGVHRTYAEDGMRVVDTLAQATHWATDEQRKRLGISDDGFDLGNKVIDRFGFHTRASLAFMRPLMALATHGDIKTLEAEIDQVEALGCDA